MKPLCVKVSFQVGFLEGKKVFACEVEELRMIASL